ncbi:head-tail connector protein [Geobacillus kaustophilus]|uniref:head-tail connector protein n=1 Tax=Geobacillus kaustophilus TaxID=1462 RepID=UPI0009E56D8F|nr:head-tail connector protein [Geobacillus kaustophilus]
MIISVDEAKEWLRVDHNDEDNMIQMLIKAAEKFHGQRFALHPGMKIPLFFP